MSPTNAYEVVRSVGWLSRQPEAFVRTILSAARLVEIARGEHLYSLDDATGGLFGVVSGHVDVFIAPGPFPPMLAHIGGPGWWVGEAALITRTRRRAELRARDRVHVLFLPEATVEAIAVQDPLIWRRLAEISVSHLDDALSVAACLGAKDYMQRLASTLLRLAGPTHRSTTSVTIPIAQGELSEMVGLSRNTVVRLIGRLKDAGTVRSAYGQIVVRPDRLRALLRR